jgi:hypothetical protein
MEVRMNKVLATIRGGRVDLDSPVQWPDGTRLEVRPLESPANGDPAAEPPVPPNVRPEFWAHMNDPGRYGMDESLWPQTPEETRILLDHMAAAEPLDYTPEEQAAIEEDRRNWKELQKEMVRKNWEEADRLGE